MGRLSQISALDYSIQLTATDTLSLDDWVPNSTVGAKAGGKGHGGIRSSTDIMSERLNCVVLGGSGFLGQALCRKLVFAGCRVRSISRSGRPLGDSQPWYSDVEWIAAPISSDFAIDSLSGTNVVYHLASSTLPSTSNLDMRFDLESNTLATLRVLEAAVREQVERVVFVSSGGTVYGIPQHNPIQESHPTNPICSYGIHKLAIEKYLHLFHHLHGLKSIVLRVSNIYGEEQDCSKPLGAVAHFTSRVLHHEPIEIWGDGTIIRDYVHVDDVANALLTSATYTGPESLFNIGSGCGTSLAGLVELLREHSGLPVRVVYKPGRAFDVAENVLDISLALQELNWRPAVSLSLGLQRMLEREFSKR
jgi:UDP-glucose 4-epimerase